MQLIELYVKGTLKVEGKTTADTTDKLVDSTKKFSEYVYVGNIVTNLDTDEVAKVTAVDSDTQLSLSDDIMGDEEQYLITTDFTKVDLFEDESVTVTDTIKNVKDINKIFTPFSQQFNLPASNTNNKLFKHYEDSDIQNSFDARFRVDALIKLNGVDYKRGRLQFNSISLKNNRAHSYKVVFFGDTVNLKEYLGKDDMSKLIFPTSLEFDYTNANVKAKFIAQSDICFPLITHTKNMRLTNAGYKDNITNTFLEYTDLKPAIKVHRVIEAIETTYPKLKFDTGFFDNQHFQDLYMWLHRNEGFMSNATEGGGVQSLVNRFRFVDDEGTNWAYSSGDEIRTAYFSGAPTPYGYYGYDLTYTINGASGNDVTLIVRRGFDNNVLVQQDITTTGSDQTVNFIVYYQTLSFHPYLDLIFELQAENTFSITQGLTVKRIQSTFGTIWNVVNTGVYTAGSNTISNTVRVNEHMPKFKVIDFLTNLFKMFNLLAYKEDDKIVVRTADFFYDTGVSYDITKYVDTTSSTVERLFQFKNIEYKFKSKKSFLVQMSDEIQGNNFSQEEYGNSEWDGTDYKVELDFEKMMFERLSNEDTDTLSDIGQGAMLNKKFEPTIGAPLLFHIETTNCNGDILWNGTDSITNYNRPTQLAPYNYNSDERIALNFGQEMDEFEQEIVGTNLFAYYHRDFATSVFERQARLLKVSAYLPLHILLSYNMNDTFVISNKVYRINSIKTNLLTNKSDLELYNRLQSVSMIENSQSYFLPRVAQVTSSSIKQTEFTISWDLVTAPNVTGYDVYVNNERFSQLSNTATSDVITGLTTKNSYEVAVRVKYDLSGDTAYSLDRKIIEITT